MNPAGRHVSRASAHGDEQEGLLGSSNEGGGFNEDPRLPRLRSCVEDGDFEVAMKLYEEISPVVLDDPYLLFMKGKQEVDQGEINAAEATFSKLEGLNLDFPGLDFALGNVASAKGNYDSALVYYARLLKNNPEHGVGWLNFGLAQVKLANYPKAIKALMRAVDLLSDKTVPQIKLARVYFLEQNYDQAERILLSLKGVERDLEAMELLISICVAREEYDRAINFLAQVKSSLGDSSRVQAYFGYVYHALEEFDKSYIHYSNALALDPNYTDAINNFGILNRDMGRYSEAREYFSKALRIDSNHYGAQWGISLCYLLAGEYEKGWPCYEMRVHCDDYSTRTFDLPRWHGEEINGGLLITSEQGLGDEIMFSSCVPEAVFGKEDVILECSPKLEALFSRSFPQARVIGRAPTLQNDWIKEFSGLEKTVPIGSLPKIFRKNLTDFPSHKGYLRADANKVEYWRKRLESLGRKPKVGISWHGGVKKTKSALRSIPLVDWAPVFTQPYEFISLQYTDFSNEIADQYKYQGVVIHHWDDAIENYDETAALVAALDLVISVQTAIVHLAGALGKQTIAMISAAPEWRYRAEGDSMPWYPSVHLVRQRQLYDWQEVMDDVSRIAAGRLGLS